MGVSILVALLLLVIATAIGIGIYIYIIRRRKETFENMTFTLEEEIIRTYNSILGRDPSMDELKGLVADMNAKKIDFYTLRLMLINSDEYMRIVKTQTNTVSPDLLRMIGEREYVAKVERIYKEEMGNKLQSSLVLPYHDLYVHVFRNNDRLLRNMFKDDKYGQFEKDVLATVGLDREKLFALYDRVYGLKEIPVPSWWPTVSMGEEIAKNKFKDAEGKDVWYRAPSTSAPPVADYIIKPKSFDNAASMWQANYADLDKGVTYPWKSDKQEEVTYSSYTPVGEKPILRQPIAITMTDEVSTAKPVPPAPVTLPVSLPKPLEPLSSGSIPASFAFSPLSLLATTASTSN